ncbi:hypothetical protein F5Y04DRAFT_247118 [Hypomontagnella monticulosa]|nr:hypothetical protein F5Y04DRAFT_247118 [Hypomontagnella monticulosa]
MSSKTSKLEKSEKSIIGDNENKQYNEADDISLSRPPSYETVAGGNRPHVSGSSTSPEWVDVQEPPEAPSNEEPGVTEKEILDLATAYFPPVPAGAELPALPKPVLIPRVDPGPQIPFARAWAPELANHEVTQEDLVAFIDNLNIIITPHPVMHAVELVGFGISVIPYDAAQGIGAAVAGLATLSTFVMTYKRSKKYLALMNERYFHPRKLHVKITNSKKIMKMFNLDKKAPLLAPLTEETLDLSAQERCLKHLAQWSCELSFDDVPPPSKQTNVLRRMAAWEVRYKIAKADKDAKKSRKRAWKKHLKGKKLKEGTLEKGRIKSLGWILIQNLDEWEKGKAEKEAKKEEKKRSSSWRTIR